jgi:hypothetical protein
LKADKYFSLDPPLTYQAQNGTLLNVSVIISRVGDFKELSMTFKARFTLLLSWFDWRVEFTSLKNTSDNFNWLTKPQLEEIWLPRLIFSNCIQETRLMFDDFSALIVQRRGKPTPNPVTEIPENEIFTGAENPFLYNGTYELEFNCEFELHKFPFDFQNCHIDVSKSGLMCLNGSNLILLFQNIRNLKKA